MVKNGGYKKPKADFLQATRIKERIDHFAHTVIFMVTSWECYKIHGYPPGYKQKQKTHGVAHNTGVNHVWNSPDLYDQIDQQAGKVGKFLSNLNNDQYYHLMTLLSQHLSILVKYSTQQENSSSYTSGIWKSLSPNLIYSSIKFWIMDSGAS